MRTAKCGVVLLAVLTLAPRHPAASEAKVRRCSSPAFDLKLAPVVNDSLRCLSCHDGSVASDRVPLDPMLRGLGRMGEHPVMISYEQASVRNPQTLVPSTLLDRRIKLFDGTIQCVTCHAEPSRSRELFVMPNQRDELCRSCHRK